MFLQCLCNDMLNNNHLKTVVQVSFKGPVQTRSFEGSIDVGLPTPSQVYHLFCWVRWPAFLGF